MKYQTLLIILFFFTIKVSAGEIYQCLDQNGKKTYTDRPCASEKVQEVFIQTENNRKNIKIVPSPEEEKAMMAALQGSIARLEDKDWINLANITAKSQGCWLTKDQLVPVGTIATFLNVLCRCVEFDLESGNGQKGYSFSPSRIADLCEKANKPHDKCVE